MLHHGMEKEQKQARSDKRTHAFHMGLAVHESFHSYVAHVAEISMKDGEVKVHRVVAAVEVRRPENLEQLASLHIWTDESVRADRLDFRPRHRLTAVVVSAAELREPVRVQRTPDYRGCASWVQLPVRPDWTNPVHDETALERIADRVRGSVG